MPRRSGGRRKVEPSGRRRTIPASLLIDHHDDPNDGVWTADDTFETVDKNGNPLSDPDEYRDLAEINSTAFRLPRDLGLPLTLKIADPQDGLKSGFFYAINLRQAGESADTYRSLIATCQDTPAPHYGELSNR